MTSSFYKIFIQTFLFCTNENISLVWIARKRCVHVDEVRPGLIHRCNAPGNRAKSCRTEILAEYTAMKGPKCRNQSKLMKSVYPPASFTQFQPEREPWFFKFVSSVLNATQSPTILVCLWLIIKSLASLWLGILIFFPSVWSIFTRKKWSIQDTNGYWIVSDMFSFYLESVYSRK